MKYKPGDHWDHEDANELLEWLQLSKSTRLDFDDFIDCSTPIDLAAFHVFHIGGPNAFAEWPLCVVSTETKSPVYTTGPYSAAASSSFYGYPIGFKPVKLAVEGSVGSGDICKVHTNYKAIAASTGPLIAVCDSSGGFAYFVYSAMAGIAECGFDAWPIVSTDSGDVFILGSQDGCGVRLERDPCVPGTPEPSGSTAGPSASTPTEETAPSAPTEETAP